MRGSVAGDRVEGTAGLGVHPEAQAKQAAALGRGHAARSLAAM